MADNSPLPFGDPCRMCGAASANADSRDRVCVCTPCAVCLEPSLSTCAHCGRSLGCKQHRVSRTLLEEIRDHVEACPLGYHDTTMCTHRSTKPEDIIEWLVKLKSLTGARR